MKILIFGGTTEGRKLSEILSKSGHKITLSVTTQYAATIATKNSQLSTLNSPLPEALNSQLFTSRSSPKLPKALNAPLAESEMLELLKKNDFDCVIDATHPYAAAATQNIKSACRAAGIKYLRLIRPESALNPNIQYVPDAASAIETLNENDEKALLAIGSKELKAFTNVKNYTQRLFIRILPMQESLKKAYDLGYSGPNIICMQGPFDKEMNIASIKMTGAKYLITKDSGDIGGFEAKISAAETMGCKIIVIARPEKETGSTYSELLETFGIKENNKENETEKTSYKSKIPPTHKNPESSFFPLFINIKNKTILVLGGGKVAERRIKTLIPYDADLVVISPKVTEYIKTAAEQGTICLLERKYEKGDIIGLDPILVIAATDDRQTNREAMKEAEKLNTQISVADCREECTCYFPAIAENESFIAGLISKNGDHKGVKKLAEKIRSMLNI